MYNHKKIEKKWQAYWEKNKTFKVENDFSKPKYYTLDMFPYPSWAWLHVGHPEWMTANDIVARYKTACWFNVLHPMGWDAFWLPAENYAIKTGTHPRITTDENITTFKKQIRGLWFSYDWDREIDTTDPEYYKWTQWIFLKLFEKGLAYEQDLPINYCPSCKTGLANEEVQNDFTCERCWTKVEKKKIRQWVLAITKYADRLLNDVDKLDWPKWIKDMQRNWIWKSEWCEFEMKVAYEEYKSIKVYTTRIDTVFGMTYAVLAPDHPHINDFIEPSHEKDCLKYIKEAWKKSDQDRTQDDKEKTWIFTWTYVVNPFNWKQVPLWIWDYVLWNYWTGAVMAVPAHDIRDYEFAKKYNLEIIESVSWWDINKKAYTDLWTLVNSLDFDWLKSKEAKTKLTNFAEKNKFWEKKVNYKLRDWLFSRQRYWGEPIPLVHCDKCGIVEEKEENLPILLPDTDHFEPSGDGTSPLTKINSFVNCKCPKCGWPWKRETNTMPQWWGSCWYYLRFMDPNNKEALVDSKVVKYWWEVDSYVWWAEHAVLHLLYARFWHKFLFDIWVVPTDEPFYRLRNQWLIQSHVYDTKKWQSIHMDSVEEKNWKYFHKETKEELTKKIWKMSKSLWNVINPDDIVEEYWADSFRLYEMYMAEFKDSAPWDTKWIVWVKRFIEKSERLFWAEAKISKEIDDFTMKLLHKTIKKVSEDIENYKFNTAIAALIILVNNWLPQEQKNQTQWKGIFIKLLHPFAPHLAEELWEKLWNTESVFKSSWPKYDEKLIIDNKLKIAIQVLWKVRWTIEISPDEDKESVLEKAKTNPNISKWLEWKDLVKEIYVPGKIVNLVVK